MRPLHPYCTLEGRVFMAGLSGVAPLADHPLCRISRLQSGSPCVQTEKGWLRPEYALAYDRPELTLHHVACSHPGRFIELSELAGYRKSASRLLQILHHCKANLGDLRFTPLWLMAPEIIVFTTRDDMTVHHAVINQRLLQQVEELRLAWIGGVSYLTYDRC